MKPKQFVRIVQARRWVALSTFSGVIIVTVALNLLLPAKWSSETVLVLNQQAKDPMTGMPVQAYLLPGYLDTQAEIAASHNVALKVIDNLGLDKYDDIKQSYMKGTGGTGNIRDWLADVLIRNMRVTPGRESSTLTIKYSGESSKFAALMANGFAQAYMNTLLDMQATADTQRSLLFQKQLQALQNSLERGRNDCRIISARPES